MRRRYAEDPLDAEEQEEICRGFEKSHTQQNKHFAAAFSVLCLLVCLLYLFFAAKDERYHFNEASAVGSALASLSTAALALCCAARIYAQDTKMHDPTSVLLAASRRRYTLPAIALAVIPFLYHGYHTLTELRLGFAYEMSGDKWGLRDLLGHVSPHHVLFLWPPLFVALAEYSASIMQGGFGDLEMLRKTKYDFKSV
ncbi:hypothetical protein DIPPA_32338 [Diplonema papillatum]|nr:hypothetical protein DIPPA_32338 [Diplonema papillatum]